MSLLSTNGAAADITFALPYEIERIADDIDCAINIASMQEMTEFSIAGYFAFHSKNRNCSQEGSRGTILGKCKRGPNVGNNQVSGSVLLTLNHPAKEMR